MADLVRTAGASLENLIQFADELEGVGEREYEQALNKAIPKAEQIARRELVNTYQRSGVETRSGGLLNLIRGAIVRITAYKGRSSISVALAPGASKEAYVAANAVNYGRVNSKEFDISTTRTVRGISGGVVQQNLRQAGEARRKNLKKKVQGGQTDGKYSRGMYGSVTGTTKAGSAKIDTTLGSATITKAFDCFKLSAGQKARIRNALFDETLRILKEKYKRALAG